MTKSMISLCLWCLPAVVRFMNRRGKDYEPGHETTQPTIRTA